ncbi:hypothetical protein [Emticicia sp. BO119]|uniref:hypothetical protein n=1 Tax=Emticicia sp. BO119 TaxID=2757768 RepID=UPI0015F03390|nr:hypothetical protein [Emticicia sp. BO119]MBA4849407.1 hypothetical protein [Emticicia sp. BO119]
MNNETARYIINHFPNLLTTTEKMAIRHSNISFKLNFTIHDSSSQKVKVAYEKGWLNTDSAVLDLLKDGYDTFELNVIQRIMTETPEKVYFNNCPECGRLARTPYARQCRCGCQWHHIIQAQFRFESAFQINGRGFFLIGKLIKGEIKEGNYIDLTPIGLNCKPIVERIGFALKHHEGEVWEDFGLGTNELNPEQQLYIKSLGSFPLSLDILNER